VFRLKRLTGIVFIFWWLILHAQQTDSLQIGLVLSGGGAKGIAHLGVLKYLEENGIRPHYLTGTSIGAIVGAYYVAGYSPEQIKDILKNMDFEMMLSDNLPRRYLPLYIKKTGRNGFFYFPVSKKNLNIHLPRGLTDYQMFYNRLFRDLYAIQFLPHFDSLSIPVRFYATDLVSGKTVEFDKGSLIRAVVSSSAFPSIVAPQTVDGKLLTDGGVMNNYPVDEVKKLGADYVIGVDIQGRLLRENEIKGVPDILNQITGFYMYKEMPEKIKKTDWYIRPPVADFSVMDFQYADTIYKLGYSEARKHGSKLRFVKKITSSRNRIFPKPYVPDSLRFSFIQINCDEHIDEEQILWQTNFAPLKKISFDEFEEGINYLYGTGKYKQIHYWIEPDSTLVMDIVRDTIDLKFKLAYQYTPLYKINLLAGIVYQNFYKNKGILDL
jgi:NTE family protein